MLRHILSVGIFVVVALCAKLTSSANSIPIKEQGENFPVPFVSQQNDDDFFDNAFYPDINDESVNKVVRDNGDKRGDRGSQSNVPGGASRPSGAPTSGRRPSQSPKGESRPSGAPTGDRRPSQYPRGESRPSGRPTSGRGPPQYPIGESRPSGSSTSDRRPPQSPRGESRPPAIFPSSSGRGSFPLPGGQLPLPETFPTKGVDSLPSPCGESRPSDTFPDSGRRQWDGSETPHRQNSRQQGRRQDRKQQNLSKYRDSPARYIITTGNVDSGNTPNEIRIFRTNRAEYEIATGDPYKNNYLVEIIEGPNPNEINLKQITVMGGDSKIILENPTRPQIVGPY
uniref:34.5 kDa salivary protein n=1 Tax=Phlebotomus duboscqi TaxID=37738 RepID=Q06K47_PHLDU|nr:34.5 kDa salivary protein [Phlebotomus duboscqi]